MLPFHNKRKIHRAGRLLTLAAAEGGSGIARADVVRLFYASQQKQDVASAVTSDTIGSTGYLFTYTRAAGQTIHSEVPDRPASATSAKPDYDSNLRCGKCLVGFVGDTS